MCLIFEWDYAKNQINQKKQGLSFELARHVFAGPSALSIQDRLEGGEWRWQTLGMIAGQIVLLVARTARERDEGGQWVEVIRVISARKADKKERNRYEKAKFS